MPKLIIDRQLRDIGAGENLGSALMRGGHALSMPCGGHGLCGKCAVMARGALSAPDAAELALIARVPRAKPPEGFVWRMACLCSALGNVEVMGTSSGDAAGRSDVALAGSDSINLTYDGQATSDDLGVAIDIGTTTVSALLYRLSTAELVGQSHRRNSQAAFGADVISRIERANGEGVAPLQAAILSQLREMLSELSLEPGAARRLVITGNTTMLHLLTGLDPRGIGVSPFTPVSLFGDEWDLPGMPRAYLPRCIGAYVGADISCGLLAVGMGERVLPSGEVRLLVDVGTNGEMALSFGDKLLCCATAAGPAFEGAQISMGMAATPGAISKLFLRDDGTIGYRTIGDAPPIGLCGTGLISAIALMIETGAVDGSGRLEAGDPFVLGDSGVSVSQQDIRGIQLAKAAIRAGIETLLHQAGLAYDDVDALHLCGGFGSFIDPFEAAAIGLIPVELAEKARAAGNTALSGASRMLFSLKERDACARIAGQATELALSASPYFMDQYVEHMAFFEE